MARARYRKPSWDDLFDLAAGQEGLFSTAQAAAAGYSPQLLQKHLRAGRVQRVRRGVYRLVHFPPGEHEDLVAVWLWADRAGVFSHETALSLHGLSDVLPARVHLSVPSAWSRRRLRVPQGVVLAYSGVPKAERTWVGPVPVTAVQRTLTDCVAAGVAPDLMEQAVKQATARGLVPKAQLPRLARPTSTGAMMRRTRPGTSRRGSQKRELSAARLDELIEEAIVDAHDESEQATGFFTLLEEHLALPFQTVVLGLEVTVEKLHLTDDERIVAICARNRSRQRIPITDLPLPDPPPEGSDWIDAYRRWASGRGTR